MANPYHGLTCTAGTPYRPNGGHSDEVLCNFTANGNSSYSGTIYVYKYTAYPNAGYYKEVGSWISVNGGSDSGSSETIIYNSPSAQAARTVPRMAYMKYQEIPQQAEPYEAYADCNMGAAPARKYWINYDKGAYGSGSNTSVEKTHNVSKNLLGETFSRSGYKQTGWSTTDGGAKAYNLSASYSGNGDVTLYPYWEVQSILHVVDKNNVERTITNIWVVDEGGAHKIIGCYAVDENGVHQGVK